ncbi:hypothetical protein GDO78_010773 [Eleutherodactylus coqui]|uniref:AMOP domain-containing protein n=1 Tax=Eleutherodactylus coqui TaxID=57060 RepID=A0A8J6K5M1_ELECQ|nr:hypothetical protein GDO78_010773 [Eleutherodactylus coqui]
MPHARSRMAPIVLRAVRCGTKQGKPLRQRRRPGERRRWRCWSPAVTAGSSSDLPAVRTMHGLPLLLLLLHFRPQLPTGAPTVSPQLAQDNLVTAQWRGASEQPQVQEAEGLPTPADIVPTQVSKLHLVLRGLSQANLSSENPNIQVTIEVDPSSQTEVELDLSDTRTEWSDPKWRSQHELFWPLFWEYSDFSDAEVSPTSDVRIENGGDSSQYDWDDNVLSGGDNGRSSPSENWITDKYLYDYEDEDWSSWSPCSATCGHPNQKRTRSCGYSCTATESRVCDLPSCPGENDTENSTPLWLTKARSSAPTQASGDINPPHSSPFLHLPPLTSFLTLSISSYIPVSLFLCPFLPRCPLSHTPSIFSLCLLTSCIRLLLLSSLASQDSCDRWLTCKSDFLSNYLQRVLTELPSCPCYYPSEVVYSSLVLRDEKLARNFRWRDASGMRERLDIYNPGARFCLRSLLSRDSSSLGAQHCCYDHSLKLVTRGRAAGIPNLISAEFSPELHYKTDVLPWILCKGDWSRIHPLRPPNNGYGCLENPNEEEYLTQLQEAREF